MEQITVLVAMTPPVAGVQASLKSLRVGQQEMPTQGRTIAQYLHDLRQQGWQLAVASATPTPQGAVCQYEFVR